MTRATGNPALPRRDIEAWLSRALTAGVLLAATVTMVGGGLHLTRHAGEVAEFNVFRPDSSAPWTVRAVVDGLRHGDSWAIMQMGLALLILTPVARVVLSLLLFALKRDWLYTVITILVLSALVVGLAGIVG